MEKVENLSHELEGNMKEVLNSLLSVESKLIGILSKHNLDSRGFLEKFKVENKGFAYVLRGKYLQSGYGFSRSLGTNLLIRNGGSCVPNRPACPLFIKI